jgi:hypothetical protein
MFDYQMSLDYWSGKLGCELKQPSPETDGMMYVEFGYVEGPAIAFDRSYKYSNQQIRYMVCMHELGHFALNHTQGRPPKENEKFYFENGVLKSEAQAWDWALNNRIEEEISDETRRFMWNTCLGSYYNGALSANGKSGQRLGNGNRHHVSFTYDEPDNFFWSVRERMLAGE